MSKLSGILTSVAAAALAFGFAAAPAHAGDIVGLITKTNTNPFFVKMKQGFEAKAKELGLTPQAYAGKFDGDNDGQVAAIEQLMAAGAKGILLVPSDSTAIVPTVKKARDAGIVVITLDTSLDPPTAADAQYRHRQLQGRRADRRVGEGEARRQGQDRQDRHTRPRRQRAVGRLLPPQRLPRPGFGIPVKDAKHFAQSDSPQIVGSDVTQGSTEGGRKAMENILQKADQIDVVYAINEPAAYGGMAALKAAGKDKGVIAVAIDGGCFAMPWVKDGIIAATSQQYPLLMAADGVEANRRVHQERQEAARASTAARSSSPTNRCPASRRSPSKRA